MLRATQAIQAMRAAQAAARNAATNGPDNLGADPNHPGQLLPNVPNGLGAGGLQVTSGVGSDPTLWQNANLPTQSNANGQTTVTIQQTAQKAILTWGTFNVGRQTSLYFNQSAGTAADGTNNWVVFNRILDPSGAPSQILGQIKAEGSVYLINQNGIIFGGSSQINIHSLIASSLPLLGDLSNNQMIPGSAAYDAAVSASNTTFLSSGIEGIYHSPILGSSGTTPLATVQSYGDISVQPGATITVGNLGYALIAAPNVSNQGSLTANGGQIALVAGMGVVLIQPGTASSGNVAQLHPFAVGNTPSAGRLDTTPLFNVTNTGLIEATTGDVTMTGYSVTQAGVVRVTTGVTQPGSITLRAQDENTSIGTSDGGGRIGPLIFAPQSVTAIVPEENGQTTTSSAAATAAFQPGSASLIGGSVTFQGDGQGGGALLYAPGANAMISTQFNSNFSYAPGDPTVHGRIYVDNGAIIDVAGLPDVQLPMSANFVTIGPITANDLADTPLQRDGYLASNGSTGRSIVVDSRISGTTIDGRAWVGSPLVDAQGYVQDMPRSIDQMLINGGTLNLNGAEVITAPSSTLNLAGGYLHYLGGMVPNIRYIGADGRIYSAATADPNVPIVGIAGQFTVNHSRWGITEVYISPLLAGGSTYESDYIQGGNAGALNINTVPVIPGGPAATILAGQILAMAEAGRHQVANGMLPSGGSLAINAAQAIAFTDQGTTLSDIAANFTAATSLATPAMLAKTADDPSNILFTSTLSSALLDAAGLSAVSVVTNTNRITVNQGATLAVQPGGKITFSAAIASIYGSLIAPSGQIGITTTGLTTTIFTSLLPDPTSTAVPISGDIIIGSGAVLSAAGRWVNDSGAAIDQIAGNANINGGSISLTTLQSSGQQLLSGDRRTGSPTYGPTLDTTGAIDLQAGSLLDVSSGGYVKPNGQLQTVNGIPAGRGGSIALVTYYAASLGLNFGGTAGQALPAAQPTTGRIVMDGSLRGYGFSGGGTLSLQAPGIQIGGDPATAPDGTLTLPASFFTNQGFGAYSLISEYDATIVAGTTVTPIQANFIPNVPALLQAPTGTSLYGVGTTQPDGTLVTLGRLDPYHRQATSFSLTAGNYLNWNATADPNSFVPPNFQGVSGTLLLDQGASIVADAGASITLGSYGQLTDLGAIRAPGGAITLSGLYTLGTSPTRSIWLGSKASLDASGTVLLDPFAAPVVGAAGLITPRTGQVLPGGSVTMLSFDGYLVAQPGAVIDVSGTTGVLDLPSGPSAAPGLTRQPLTTPTQVWSNAGQITLGATNGLYFDGTLVAHGGASQAQGGSLTITDAHFNNYNRSFAAVGILLQQSGLLVPQGLQPGMASPLPSGIEYFAADRLDGSGITQLMLGVDPGTPTANNAGPITIGFAGDVSLSLGQSFIANAANFVALAAGTTSLPGLAGTPALSAGQSSVGGTTVSITAPYVQLGGNNSNNGSFKPVLALADGTLNITAVTANGTPGLIDLTGRFGLQNFGQANFTSSGDIRFYTVVAFASTIGSASLLPGELVTPGNLTFTATQLYPATASTFIIDASANGLTDANGNALTTTVTILPNGASSTPLSAAGSLLIDATTIIQSGTIRAPSGTLVLGVSDTTAQAAAFNNLPLVQTQTVTLAAGSITSVSLDGAIIPYGTTVDGTNWQYQIYSPGNVTQTSPNLTAPPGKTISINGLTVTLAGATIDLSGGGDLQAQEWVAGTGGSRNLLLQTNTSYASGATPIQVPLFPDGRQIYAILPGYNASGAPYDPEFAQPGTAVGQSVYLSGAPGLPAGTYTLLPAQYATLPGAFRVVQNTGVSDALARSNVTLPDGTTIVAGSFVNALAGTSSARSTSFMVQSQSVWRQYSDYTLISANSFFAAQATAAGNPTPRLPLDAGQLSIAAINSLGLGAILNTSAPGGRGAQVDIASQDIQIIGTGEAAMPGYLTISASSLDAIGAESLLIGGTRTNTASGVTINAVANSIVVANDATNPLTGPEILLVTKTDPSGIDPNAANGLLVQSGSVIRAKGTIAASSDLPISIGRVATSSVAGVSGDGALLIVSNGAPVTVTRLNVPSSPAGLLQIQDGAKIDGGNALLLDSSGNTLVGGDATLLGTTITADARAITFVTQNNATGNGLVIGPNTLAQLQNASRIILQSTGAIDFQGDVTVALGSGTLELGAGAFTNSTGSTVTIAAPNVILTNVLGGQPGTWSGPTSGSLTINAGELDFGTGQRATATAPITSAFYGFSSVTANATAAVVGQGTGGVFDFGSTPVTFNTPLVLADSGSSQTLQTTGAFTLASLASAPLQRAALGGAINLTGGTLTDAIAIAAPAGNVGLRATSGDLLLGANATISVAGVAKQFYDVTQYAPAGAITLTADLGNINVAVGAVIDFSAAAGGGNAGSLSVSAPVQSATLQGIIHGGASNGFTGGSFSLDTGGAADLDALAQQLAASGVTKLISVHTRTGNLSLASGDVLTAATVSLIADSGAGNFTDTANGNVVINGTINASGAAGGTINLFGKNGVDVEGTLLAVGTSSTQLGGTVNIGTSAVFDPTTGTYNTSYGYETIANSGAITIGPGAVINVGGGTIDNLNGGVINLRAPLLGNGDVNVTIAGTASLQGAHAINLEAYAVWSTTDRGGTAGPQHFDGIVDPAGWYDSNGALLSGTFVNQNGGVVLNYTAGSMTAAQLAPYLSQDYFVPGTANSDHQTFYGYLDGDTTQARPGTLMGFIQAPGFTFANRFAGIIGFNVRPGVELDNPSRVTNNGNVSVLTNWNLGASDASGNLLFRYGGQAPFITLRATNNIAVNASISDGFHQTASLFSVEGPTYASDLAAYLSAMQTDTSSTIRFVSGTSESFFPTDPNYLLTKPSENQSSGYYTAYMTYLSGYETWYGDITLNQGFFEPISLSAPPNPSSYTTYTAYVSDYQAWANTAYPAAPNPANYRNYALYLFRYSQWFNRTFIAQDGSMSATATPVAPTPPSDPSNYADYVDKLTTFYYSELSSVYDPAGNNQYMFALTPPLAASSGTGGSAPTFPPPLIVGNSPANMPTPTNPAPLQMANLLPNANLSGGTSSYRFVAGADMSAANPLTVLAGSTGNVTVDGHFSAVDINNTTAASQPTLVFPTVIRTGTGSIDIAAAGDVALLDNTAPGVIYTAGTPAAGTTAGPTISILQTQANGSGTLAAEILVTGQVNPVAGGNISISAGRDVIGVEQVYDTTGAITGTTGAYLGQFWWPWMQTGNPKISGSDPNGNGVLAASSSSINFGGFDQGIMSVGGNVSIAAGRNINDLSVSLPSTWYLTTPDPVTGAPVQVSSYSLVHGVVTTPNLTVNTVGGGNLAVSAGGDIMSGSYFVAKGTGTITAGGSIGSDFTFAPVNDTSFYTHTQITTPVSTLLAMQDAVVNVTARQTIDIGGVYNPSYSSIPLTGTSTESQSYSARSSLSLLSTTGDVRFDTNRLPATLFNYGPIGNTDSFAPPTNDGLVLPASLFLTALNGGISIQGPGELYPSVNGQLSLIADGTIQLSNAVAGASNPYFGVSDLPASAYASPLAQYGASTGGLLAPATGAARYAPQLSLHAQDPAPVRIYSLTGDIIDGATNPTTGFFVNELTIVPNKPAFVYAGHDIVNLSLFGQNDLASDVTRIIAGHDIYDTPLPGGSSSGVGMDLPGSGSAPLLGLAGPGTFDIEAGRNIGPLTSANEANQQGFSNPILSSVATGIQTFGNRFNAYLPSQSAAIDLLFGIGRGIEDQNFANSYINPASPLPGLPDFSDQLVAFIQQYQTDQATRNGVTGSIATLTPSQAWAVFETLPDYRQRILIESALFQILNQTGLDYNNAASPYHLQYARGYQAINTLFPAADGYTANNLGGGANGANAPVSTGYLDMRGSTVQTQQGGNISILGPGGRILVGSSSAPPYIVDSNGRTLVGPNNQGILTLETGNIDIFSDQSILLAQSRIFTEQGGDIVIWSSNGDINAGKGVKTTSEIPPPQYVCDPTGYCTVDAKSQVTGAGIAVIQTKPDAPVGNANLIAPRGTVDAGAAGIRVSGNLNIAALFIANAFNIQVQGVTVGVPTVAAPPIGALTTAGNTAAATQTALPPQSNANDRPSVIIVEVLGYGGGDGTPDPRRDDERQRSRSDNGQRQDPDSAVQVIGAGDLSPEQRQKLSETERRNFDKP